MRCLPLVVCGLVAGCSLLFDPSGDSDGGPEVDSGGIPVDGGRTDAVWVECPEDTIALYHFDQDALLTDSCAVDVDLSFESGGLASASGQDGGGVTFTGVEQLIERTPPLNSPEVKFEAWVNPSSSPTRDTQGVVAWNDANGASNIAFRVVLIRDQGNPGLWTVAVEHSNASCTELMPLQTPAMIQGGQFNHLAVTRDNTDLTVYVDGREVGNAQTTTTLCPLDGTSGYLAVGAGSDVVPADDLFEGVIDEVRISSSSAPPRSSP